MKSFKWSLFILLLIVGLTGCKKDKDDETPVVQDGSGAISVSVFFNGQPVSGATITTEPETGEGTTGGNGNLIIENVPEGIYQVFATHEVLGSGSGALVVSSGETGQVQVNLVPGAFVGPHVNLIAPSLVNTNVGELISITAIVSDNVDAVTDLVFEWSTDVDGVISTDGASVSGYAELEHVFDEEGLRTLTVTVTNSEGNTDSDQVDILVTYVPNPVVLDPIGIEHYALSLNWSETSEDNFVSYRVYRQGQFG